MIMIKYCNWGTPISDFDVEEWYQSIRTGGDFYISSEIAVTRVRVAVKEGELNPEDVSFCYKGICQFPDKDGRLAQWPEGFCDVSERLLERLL